VSVTGGISFQVVAVSRGVVAAWMRVEVYRLEPERTQLVSAEAEHIQ